MTWIGETAAGTTLFDRVFNLRPNLYADYQRFASLFWSERLVDPVLLELCRLRIAQLLRCEAERCLRRAPARAAGLSEDKIAALPRWPADPQFSALERAGLAFAEKFVIDPHAITDDDTAAVTAHLSPAAMVAFTEALALFEGFARFQVLLGIGA